MEVVEVMEEDMEGTVVMEREKLNQVMEVMEVMVEEDLMEAMEVVMEVMVMEVMVMERGMPNPVTEVMEEDHMEVMEEDHMEVMEEDHMVVMVAADLMEDMEDTMDNMDNITFHSSYAPKIVNTSACKFTQLLFVINDKLMNLFKWMASFLR